jgi:protein SCO1/2
MRTPALLLSLLIFAVPALAEPTYPPQSIYHLDAALTDQSGKQVGLDVQRGHPVLVTMFYASCPMTCPMLIDTLRAIERAVPQEQRSNLRVVMISIDAERDTPEKLRQLADQRRMDLSRWTLVRADSPMVRKIAALLNVQYRQLPDGNYNHSNVISLLSPHGEIVAQSSMLGKADESLIQALAELAPANFSGIP